MSQLARGIFGGRGVPYYLVQAATMLILVLAANTAYSDFPAWPRSCPATAFFPRQFMNQGDRLAFSNGIVVLSVLRGRADGGLRRRHPRRSPPLHDRRLHLLHPFPDRAWWSTGAGRAAGLAARSALINAFGAIPTFVVLVIVAVTKSRKGRGSSCPDSVLVLHFRLRAAALRPRGGAALLEELAPHRHSPTRSSSHQRHAPGGGGGSPIRGSLSPDVRAVYVDTDPHATEKCGRTGSVGAGGAPRRPALALPLVDGAPSRIRRGSREEHPATT